MALKPVPVNVYHVFLASPGDVNAERQYVRQFFDEYNRHTAHLWNAEFRGIDWENFATIGIGRPQELITKQTLERFKASLALVVGVMAQRFGSPTGKAESGTEEEFLWAKQHHDATAFPEIKWFFRKIEKLDIPADPDEADKALDQWKKVRAFRQRMQDLNDPIFYTEYSSPNGFAKVFDHDLHLWLNDPSQPWAKEIAASDRATIAGTLPAEFDSERYRAAVLKRFEKLNLEMVDSTGAYYSVRLWTVFVPQSARECHQYNPRLLEIPKDHQQRLLKAGEIDARELADSLRQAEALRREYFQQPLSPVLEIIDQAQFHRQSRANHRLVILGDPGSGKSSLIRYLALRWSSIIDPATRQAQSIPLVIDLGSYGRWKCDGQKGFVRFLEEAPVWHDWPRGLLERLLSPSGRVVLLLDGLDEIFDLQAREEVVNDIQRFSTAYAQTPILITSRTVGYQSQRLRDADFRHFMLQDLDNAQIDDFIDRWHTQTFDDPAQAAPKHERLKKAIRDSKSIAMLAGNPLLLTMMAILNRNQELPRDRVDLYAQASRLLLHQWDTERALAEFPGLSTDIGWREKHDLLRRVASFMQEDPSGLKGNMIDGPTLAGLIEDYLCTDLHFPQSRAAARAVVDHLRQRNFILCFVGADSYGFVHRTFLEYFCAADFVHRFNIAKTLDEAGLLALFDMHCCEDEWREVLRLICSQIDDQFVGKIVERLATRTDLNQWDGRAALPELPLAIECLNEARNLPRLENAGSQLLKSVIDCVSAANGEGRDLIDYLLSELVTAANDLGTKWPGKSLLEQVALSQIATLDLDGQFVWPKLVASVLCDESLVRAMSVWDGNTKQTDWLHGAALEALAAKWPDESTRELLSARAIEDEYDHVRLVALRSLATKWPSESTRELLRARAIVDPSAEVRTATLQSLAAKWPDESTREFLHTRAIEDRIGMVRSTALQALADKWPDESTRDLLRARAVQDQGTHSRRAALRLMAEKWPDESTRDLLRARAVEDLEAGPRSTAMQALAETWPDEFTRDLLRARAVEDLGDGARGTALQSLAKMRPDGPTRDLLQARAVEDLGAEARSTALQSLAETWPDESTRVLLCARAVKDLEVNVRGTAALCLAETWPDESTHVLLRVLAVEDQYEYVRTIALESLAKTWPDESTRVLLHSRSVEDPNGSARSVALRSIVRGWPEESTRDLLCARAVEDQGSGPRITALQSLAEKWQDGATRHLLCARAVEDLGDRVRGAAVQSLAETWPDESTRHLLRTLAVGDPATGTRSDALRSLAETWPDESTRDLLRVRAVEDAGTVPRSAALRSLAKKWRDESTRDLLRARAVEDPCIGPRSAALQSLAETWQDESTRDLLRARTVEDPDPGPRNIALQCLAETWPDDSTLELLRARAIEDHGTAPRSSALQYLAVWWRQDESTRDLLSVRAIEDPGPGPRSTALQSLAEAWPDKSTRDLLRIRAVEDPDSAPRNAALRSLADTWPDGATRKLLRVRAVEDRSGSVRSTALRSLAASWPDEATRDLLRVRVVEDQSKFVRGVACSAFGGMHSLFGKILWTKDLDGAAPYLDHLQPLSAAQIQKGAKKTGIPTAALEAQIDSLNRHMGWDIRVGARPNARSAAAAI